MLVALALIAGFAPAQLSVLVADDDGLVSDWRSACNSEEPVGDFLKKHGLGSFAIENPSLEVGQVTCHVSKSIFDPESGNYKAELMNAIAGHSGVADRTVNLTDLPRDAQRLLREQLVATGDPLLATLASAPNFSFGMGVGATATLESSGERSTVWISSQNPQVRASTSNLVKSKSGASGPIDPDALAQIMRKWAPHTASKPWVVAISNPSFRTDSTSVIFARVTKELSDRITRQRLETDQALDTLLHNLSSGRAGWDEARRSKGRLVGSLDPNLLAALKRGQAQDGKLPQDIASSTLEGFMCYPMIEIKVSVNGSETVYRFPIRK